MTQQKVVTQNVCNSCWRLQISKHLKGNSCSIQQREKISNTLKNYYANPENKKKMIESRGQNYEKFIENQEKLKKPKTCKYCGTTENLVIRDIHNHTNKIKTVTLRLCKHCEKFLNTGINNGFYGKKHTEETKLKSGESIKKWWNTTKEGSLEKVQLSIRIKQWAKDHNDLVRIYSRKGLKAAQKISSIEVKLAKCLKKNFIKFEQQWHYKLGIADFIIKPYIIVFVDGVYWHNYPYGTLKDKKQQQYLEQKGFIVLRFWEKDIINNIENVIRVINAFYHFKQNKRMLEISYKEWIQQGGVLSMTSMLGFGVRNNTPL